MVNISVINKRLGKLRAAMHLSGSGAAIVTKKENCTYLSGYTGSSAVLVISQENAALVTDSRYTEQASEQTRGIFKTVEFKGRIYPELAKALSETGVTDVLYEEYDMTCEEYAMLENECGSAIRFKHAGNLINRLRLIKDDNEVALIREAAAIADKAFMHILAYLKPGVRENEIAAEIEYFMKKNGASGQSFDTIIASGARSSMPHAEVSDRIMCVGDAVTLDFGALYKCYCSDMTRTVFIGKPPDVIHKIYDIVHEAQMNALEGAMSGKSGVEVDRIAREVISSYGYGANFGHGLGHGVGLEIHESPRLSEFSTDVMEDGMVATIEPGIYLPGEGGVRIEDMVVIRGNKPDVLTGSTKELIVL